MEKKHVILGVVVGLFLVSALLILKNQKEEDECMCGEDWRDCCCGY